MPQPFDVRLRAYSGPDAHGYQYGILCLGYLGFRVQGLEYRPSGLGSVLQPGFLGELLIVLRQAWASGAQVTECNGPE